MLTAIAGPITCGTKVSLSSSTPPTIIPPHFLSTWRRHLKHHNHSNFLRLQDHTVQAITTAYALSIDSTPFWWLLFHLDMLILAPSTTTQCSHKSIHKTICNCKNSILSGDIKYVYDIAMTCMPHSQNNSHVAHTFRKKIARHMLPFNYAIGTPNRTNLIINTIQLQVEKYISLPQSTGCIPTRAAVFFILTNQLNSVSLEAFFNVISESFPEMLPLTTLFYEHAATVHHKWANGTWRTLLMEKGISQGYPLSPKVASLVVANLLQLLDIELRKRATTRLLNGDPGDNGFGGITHLLEYVDDVSACLPLADLQFLCNQFATIGAPLGCLSTQR
jgi:hypothetical protein